MSKPFARSGSSCSATMSAPISASTRAMRSGAKRRSIPIAPWVLYEAMTILLLARLKSGVLASTAQAPVDGEGESCDRGSDDSEQGPCPRTRMHQRGNQPIDQECIEDDAGEHAESRPDQVGHTPHVRSARDHVNNAIRRDRDDTDEHDRDDA